MKTIYLIKSFLPFVFLPIAPGVMQLELERRGILAPNSSLFLAILMQILVTALIVAWVAYAMNRRQLSNKAFVKMSSLSKKVFHDNEWMSVEQYLDKCHGIIVSHGLTPEECEAWIRESEAYLGAELPDLRSEKRSTPKVAIAK